MNSTSTSASSRQRTLMLSSSWLGISTTQTPRVFPQLQGHINHTRKQHPRQCLHHTQRCLQSPSPPTPRGLRSHHCYVNASIQTSGQNHQTSNKPEAMADRGSLQTLERSPPLELEMRWARRQPGPTCHEASGRPRHNTPGGSPTASATAETPGTCGEGSRPSQTTSPLRRPVAAPPLC